MDKKYLEDIIKKILFEINFEVNNEKNSVIRNSEQEKMGKGLFSTLEIAVEKAVQAQKKYEKCSLESREMLIECLRKNLMEYVDEISQKDLEETGKGKLKDKIRVNTLTIKKTPGVESLSTEVFTGDSGLTLTELSAFGVIGIVIPTVNPAATIINSVICTLAAGNSVVFYSHRETKYISEYLVRLINKISQKIEGIPENLVTISTDTGNMEDLYNNRHINMLFIMEQGDLTGKTFVNGKKVIVAGQGNTPVIVDETVDIPITAKYIVNGASFDNNVLEISERVVLAMEDVADYLLFSMEKEGALKIRDKSDIQKLEKCILKNGRPDKNYIGKDAVYILKSAGIAFEGNPEIIIVETDFSHKFVQRRLMMPVIPVIRIKDFKEMIEKAVQIEKDFKHTAVIHSQNITRLSEAAKTIKTSIFVKNAPSYAGLGLESGKYTGIVVGNITGEGIISAKDFTRKRKCVLSGSFSIR